MFDNLFGLYRILDNFNVQPMFSQYFPLKPGMQKHV